MRAKLAELGVDAPPPPTPALSPRELRDRIGAATSAAEVLDVVATAPSSLDGPTATHALYWLARCCASERSATREKAAALDAAALAQLVSRLEQTASGLGAREVSKAASALGKLLQRAGADAEAPSLRRALAAVTDCCVRGATALDAQAVATVLHAHASGGCAPAEASLRALQQRAATLASDGDFNPQDSANTLWAFAKLGVPPDSALAAALAWRLADGAAAAMKPFELSSTAWALAKLHAAGRLPDELATAEVVNALHDAATASVAWMNAQASANTLWAFSRLEPPPPPALCDALLRRAEACARAT